MQGAFPLDENALTQREQCMACGECEGQSLLYARQFAEADSIVIAAPHWDLSFPAALKQFIEHINVVGITFVYTPEGIPQGLCKAKELYYVTTAGGDFVPEEFGFGYVKTLAQSFYGISKVEKIEAVGLDLEGADPESILQEAIRGIRKM